LIDTGPSLTRRHIIKIGAITFIISMSSLLGSSPAIAATPLRRNINSLSPDELENYKHAVNILMQRGLTNPGAMDGYAWQAALHNDFERVRPDGSEGACEHRSELFFRGIEPILRGSSFSCGPRIRPALPT